MKLNARVGRYSIAFCYGLLLAFMPILANESPSFFGRMLGKGSRLQQKMKGLTAKLFGASKPYQVLDPVPAQLYISQQGPVPIRFSPPPVGADFRQPVSSPRYEDPRGPPPPVRHGVPAPMRPDNAQWSAAPNPNAAHKINNDDEAEFHNAEDHFGDREAEQEAAADHHDDRDDNADHKNQDDQDHFNDHNDQGKHNEREVHDHDDYDDRMPSNRIKQEPHDRPESDHDHEYDREHEQGYVPNEDHAHEREHQDTDVDHRPVDDFEGQKLGSEPNDGQDPHSQPLSSSNNDPIDHPRRTEDGNHHDHHPEKIMFAKQPIVNSHDEDEGDDGARYDHQHLSQSEESGEDEHLSRRENLHREELERPTEFQGHPEHKQTSSAMSQHQNGYQEPSSSFDSYDKPNEDQGDYENHGDRDVAYDTEPVRYQINDEEGNSPIGLEDNSIASQTDGRHQSRQDKFDAPNEDEHEHVDTVQSLGDQIVSLTEDPNRQIPTLGTDDPQRPRTDSKLQGRQFAKSKRRHSEFEGGPSVKPEDEFDFRNWAQPQQQTEQNPQAQTEEEALKEASFESEFQDDDEFSNVGPEMDSLDELDFDERLIPIDTFEVVEKFIDEPIESESESESVNSEELPKVEKKISNELPTVDEPETPREDHEMKVSQLQDLKSVEESSVTRPSDRNDDEKQTLPSEQNDLNVAGELENGGQREPDSESTNEKARDESKLRELEPITDEFVELSTVAQPETFNEEAMKVSRHKETAREVGKENPAKQERINEELVDESLKSDLDKHQDLAPNQALDKSHNSQLGSGYDADRTEVGIPETSTVDGNTLQTPSISAALIPDEPEHREKASGGIGFEFAEPPKVLSEASSSKVQSSPETIETKEEKPSHEQMESKVSDIAELPKRSDIERLTVLPEKHFEEFPSESASAIDENPHKELNGYENDSTTTDEHPDKQEMYTKIGDPSEIMNDTGLSVSMSPVSTKESTSLLNDSIKSKPSLKSIDVESIDDEQSHAGKSEIKEHVHSWNDNNGYAHNDAFDSEFNLRQIVRDLPHEGESEQSGNNKEAQALGDTALFGMQRRLLNEPELSSREGEDRSGSESRPRVVSSIRERSNENQTERSVDGSEFKSAGSQDETSALNENEETDAENPAASESHQNDKPKHQLDVSVRQEDSHQGNQPAIDNIPRLNREDPFLGREHEFRDQTEEMQLDHDEKDQIVYREGKEESRDKISNDSMASSEEIKAELALIPLPPMLDAKGLEMTKKRRFKNGYKLNTNRNRIPKLNHRLSIETDDWNPERELIARREGRFVKGGGDSASGKSQKLSKNSEELAKIVSSTIGNGRIQNIAYKPKRPIRVQ